MQRQAPVLEIQRKNSHEPLPKTFCAQIVKQYSLLVLPLAISNRGEFSTPVLTWKCIGRRVTALKIS